MMTKIIKLPKVRNKHLNDILKSKRNARHEDKRKKTLDRAFKREAYE